MFLSSDSKNNTDRRSSSYLNSNINNILRTFVPQDSQRQNEIFDASLRVKSHGTITFTDNKSNRAEFIRILPDASVTEAKKLLERQWCKERPSLVISVTGGAKDYNMKPKLLRAFRRGLSKVARTTGSWIITGGMNTGIMKLVGEIVQLNPDRSRPIHLIGIATWGCIAGVNQLDVHGATIQYCKPREERKGVAPLEPNHTKFIFIDDGSERKYGGEIEFRARLEQAISGGFFGPRSAGSEDILEEQSDAIPVVLLVVEGGPNTVRTVHEAVVQNNIPAVFFEGTGRCCDLFAKAYQLYNQHSQKLELNDETRYSDSEPILKRYDELKSKLREELASDIRSIAGPKDKTDYFELVYECVHTRKNFLNVVTLDHRSSSDPDIDLAILRALLNATSGSDMKKSTNQQRREKFHLALQWNRVDIARDYIMKDIQHWNKINLNDLFLLALNRNQTDFVKLFFDSDFSVSNVFRDKQALPLLYLKSMKKYANVDSMPDDSLKMIYEDIIQPLIGDAFDINAVLHLNQNMFDDSTERQRTTSCFGCCRSKTTTNGDVELSFERSASVRSDSDSHFDVDKELFIWSVITGQRDFNLLFWARGKNKICAALFATLVYRIRAQQDNDSSYNHSADLFEQLAVEILNKFHEINPRICTKAIIRQIPAFGNVTWLDLAIKAEAKEFIAQRAVQDVLVNIWYGYIDHRESQQMIIFASLTFWYSGFLRYHDQLVKTSEQQTFLDNLFSKSKLVQESSTFNKSRRKTCRVEQNLERRLLGTEPIINYQPIEFVQMGCWEKTKHGIVKYFNNIVKFLRAPYVKYLYGLYSHIILLSLFSFLLLCDFHPLYDYQTDVCPPKISYAIDKDDSDDDVKNSDYQGLIKHDRLSTIEYILIGWIFTLFCEELRQFFASDATTFRNMLAAYFSVFWNILDCIALLLFIIGMILRVIPSVECFCAARIVLSVDLAIWFLRLLNIFAAIKRLGPKLVMIGEMANDLKVYAVMLVIFILGYGISSFSIIYGTRPFSWHIIRRILNLAFWQIFGDLNILEIFGNNYRANGYAAFFLLVIYMTVSAILLVNLLIAMFSNTFDRLENDTDRIWKFQRYSLICEYLSRPSLPAPLIIFSHIWRLFLYALGSRINSSWFKAAYAQHGHRTQYKTCLDEKSATNIEIAEDVLGDDVYMNFLRTGRTLIQTTNNDEDRIRTPQETMFNRIQTIEDRLQLLNNHQMNMFIYLDSIMDGLRLVGGEQIKLPAQYHYDPDEFYEESTNDPTKKTVARRDSLLNIPHQSSTQSEDSSPGNLLPQY